MTGSAIPAARRALLDALSSSADTAFTDTRFFDVGDWTEPIPHGARITVETSRDVNRQWAGLGPALRLEEKFTLPVRIEVLITGHDLSAVETRLWELAAAIEKTVIGDVTLSGTVRQCLPAGSETGEQLGPSTVGGTAGELELLFDCQQRIQLS